MSYYADFVIVPLLIAVLAVSAPIGVSQAWLAAWAGWAVGGYAAWTVFEYMVHRFVYHRVPLFKRIHDAHHADPAGLIGAPPVIGPAMLMLLWYTPMTGIGPVAASGFAAGGLVGYFAYMVVHHAAHHWRPSPGTWLWRLRRHHAQHHHAAEDGNFGIVTSIWDHLLGTAVRSRRGVRRSAS
jgi:sterol desaturase/sphingolipid hydroxylase (fatty acid hydroxylase superfamily)